jgi:hypothetical protein
MVLKLCVYSDYTYILVYNKHKTKFYVCVYSGNVIKKIKSTLGDQNSSLQGIIFKKN